MNIEQHPLLPFLPSNSKVLMLGSFPPSKNRWSMNFYYPNWINDMWRVMGIVFYQNKDHFSILPEKRFNKDLIVLFLNEKGIALSDTAKSVVRLKENASDKFLKVEEEMNIPLFLDQMKQCKAIVVTGQKASDVLCTRMNTMPPAVGSFSEFKYNNREMKLYRMPSTSRAYPMSLEKKAEAYQNMFHDLDLV